jgi:hypothetical protein
MPTPNEKGIIHITTPETQEIKGDGPNQPKQRAPHHGCILNLHAVNLTAQ